MAQEIKAEIKVSNVRFKEAVFLAGEMANNIKQGHRGATIVEDKGGVLINLPVTGAKPQITKVPLSNIKQIEFEI